MAWPPRFAFVGGTIAIDFAQTGGEGYRARWEGWHTPSDMADWAELAPGLGLRPRVSAKEYETAWRLREALCGRCGTGWPARVRSRRITR